MGSRAQTDEKRIRVYIDPENPAEVAAVERLRAEGWTVDIWTTDIEALWATPSVDGGSHTCP